VKTQYFIGYKNNKTLARVAAFERAWLRGSESI